MEKAPNMMPETPYDPVAEHNLPLAEDMSLAYLEKPDEDGYHRDVFVFNTPELHDRYVVRPLRVETGGGPGLGDEQALLVLQSELQRARDCGIAVPQVAAGLPDGWQGHWVGPDAGQAAETPNTEVMLVTERVAPAEITAENVELARQKAAKAVQGMAAYLRGSIDPSRADDTHYLTDPLRARNYMFGTLPSQPEPDFYMVDTECLVDTAGEVRDGATLMDYRLDGITQLAADLSERTADPSLRGLAAGLAREIHPAYQPGEF